MPHSWAEWTAQAGGRRIGNLDFFSSRCIININLDSRRLVSQLTALCTWLYVSTAEKKKKGWSQSAPNCSLPLRQVIPFIKQFAQLFHRLVLYHVLGATKITGDVKGFETPDGNSCFCHKWPSLEPATQGMSCRYRRSATPLLSPSPSQ